MSSRVQDSLWQVAKHASADNPGSQPGGLFIVALNDMGDRQEQRLAALNNQAPRAVFLMLHGLAIVAWGFTGYVGGRAGAQHIAANLVLATSFATVITLVADLDRPGSGLVTVSGRPLIDLKAVGHTPLP